MTEASPRPWRTGTSPGTEELTVYTHAGDTPRGTILTMFRRAEDAALAVAAVNAFGEPTSIETDLREGWRESERRRHVALAVAGHLRECLARHGDTAPVDEVLDAFTAVVAALRGATDPAQLRIADAAEVVAQVQAIVASTDGEVACG